MYQRYVPCLGSCAAAPAGLASESLLAAACTNALQEDQDALGNVHPAANTETSQNHATPKQRDRVPEEPYVCVQYQQHLAAQAAERNPSADLDKASKALRPPL